MLKNYIFISSFLTCFPLKNIHQKLSYAFLASLEIFIYMSMLDLFASYFMFQDVLIVKYLA